MNIAVTGGMGSGKSEVCNTLAVMIDALAVSADSLSRDLLAVGHPGWLAMQEAFSADFFLQDGEVNRLFLRKAIFSDSILRQKLDNILHPLIRKEFFAHFAVAEKEERDLVAEVPLLFEKGWQTDFDYTLVVFADQEVCVERIMGRDGVSRGDALESIGSQMSLVDKVRLGDSVIDNSGSLTATSEQVRQLLPKLPATSYFKRKRAKQ